jgi:hypothetical protein
MFADANPVVRDDKRVESAIMPSPTIHPPVLDPQELERLLIRR